MGRVMRFIVGFCLFFSGIVFVTWLLVPSLIKDYNINSARLEKSEAHQVETANCETKMYVLAKCEVSLSSSIDGIKNSFNYFMLKDLISENVSANIGESVHLLVSSDTGVVTTNIGLKYFANRAFTYLAFLMLLLVGFVTTWKRMISYKLLNY